MSNEIRDFVLPLHLTPIVYMTLGEKNLMTVPPQWIQSLEYEDNMGEGGGDTWSATILDQTFNEVERAIISSGGIGSLSWGYLNGPITPLRKIQVIDWMPRLTTKGRLLTIRGFDLSCQMRWFSAFEDDGTTPKNKQEFSGIGYHGKPSEVVARIASEYQEEGILSDSNPEIEDTQSILVDDYTKEEGDKKPMDFVQERDMTDEAFIKSLIPLSRSVDYDPEDKNAKLINTYYLYFTPDKVGKPILHFHPPRFDAPVHRRYNFRGQIGSIKSFEPNINGMLIGMLAGNITFSGMDSYTGAFYEVSVTSEGLTVREDGKVKRQSTRRLAIGSMALNNPYRKRGGISALYPSHFSTSEEAERAAIALWEAWNIRTFQAKATIMGDPELIAGDMVYLNILLPNGIPDYTSGKYLVMKAIHHVRKAFTMSLDCLSSHARSGNQVATGPDFKVVTGPRRVSR